MISLLSSSCVAHNLYTENGNGRPRGETDVSSFELYCIYCYDFQLSDLLNVRGQAAVDSLVMVPGNPSNDGVNMDDINNKEEISLSKEEAKSFSNEKGLEISSTKEVSVDGEEPTKEEKKKLRHVAENLPLSAWFVAVVELCERFTYYGCQVRRIRHFH